MIRAARIEPVIVDYLKTPPSRRTLKAIVKATGGPLRALLRE
jgi:arsenate reductase (glutaredoxin)